MIHSIVITICLFAFASLIYPSQGSLNRLLSQKHGKLGEPHIDFKFNLPKEEWFKQKLDHFNVTDNRTWKQRFFTNSTWYEKGGPIFLMIGGEGEISAKWMVQGAWLNYAQNYKALCFQLEHRFYGKSHPLPDMSVENLEYLSSEQALADLANFIIVTNQKYKLESPKWVVFGGSYPGSLAAWLRYKYPHLVHGAVSASGPLRAVIDFTEYFQVVTDALATVSDKCVKAVHNASHTISEMLQNKKTKFLDEIFKVCDPLDVANANDVSSFVESLADNFAGVVQYNKDYRGSSRKITVDTLCHIMMDESRLPITRYATVNSLILSDGKKTCLDYTYDKMLTEMRNTSWESSASEGGRQWMYQTCSEFGFYQTSSQPEHNFGQEFPIKFFTQQCKDIYGPKFSSEFLQNAIERTNMMYGALDLEVTRVVFVHGSIDPWHALGIYKTRNPEAPAIYINGTAHCANMYPPTDEDLPDLIKARVQINQLIGKWLQQDYHYQGEQSHIDTPSAPEYDKASLYGDDLDPMNERPNNIFQTEEVNNDANIVNVVTNEEKITLIL